MPDFTFTQHCSICKFVCLCQIFVTFGAKGCAAKGVSTSALAAKKTPQSSLFAAKFATSTSCNSQPCCVSIPLFHLTFAVISTYSLYLLFFWIVAQSWINIIHHVDHRGQGAHMFQISSLIFTADTKSNYRSNRSKMRFDNPPAPCRISAHKHDRWPRPRRIRTHLIIWVCWPMPYEKRWNKED